MVNCTTTSTPSDPRDLDRGRYDVVAVLGRSPYAAVYEAHDRKTGERVAVKVLSLAGSHREIVEAMFRKEVDALDGFDHPAVVRLRGRFTEPDADRVGVVLELVPGGRTLEHYGRGVEGATLKQFYTRPYAAPE